MARRSPRTSAFLLPAQSEPPTGADASKLWRLGRFFVKNVCKGFGVKGMVVLLLNANGAPHRIINERAALALLQRGKAVLAQAAARPLRTSSAVYPRPSVLYLTAYVPRQHVAWSRREVLARDNHRCAYCGGRGDTLDHVLPRHLCRKRGLPADTWENTAAACRACQQRKGGLTLAECGLSFRPGFRPGPPRRLRPTWARLADKRPEWKEFLG
jgi:5-methylcytosine-specific restriction endonuclease McrA